MRLRDDARRMDTGWHEHAGIARRFVHFAGWRAAAAAALVILAGAVDGVSLLVLLPVLHLAGYAGGGSASTSASSSWALDGVLGTIGQQQPLGTIILLCFCVFAAKAALSRARVLYVSDLTTRFTTHLRIDLFRAVAQARWSAIARHKTADITNILTVELPKVESGAVLLLNACSWLVSAVMYFVASVLVAPEMALLVTATGALVLLVVFPLRRRTQRLSRELAKVRTVAMRSVNEFLGGLKVAKAYGCEAGYLGRFADALRRSRDGTLDLIRTHQNAAGVYHLLGSAALCTYLYVGIVVFAMSGAEVAVLIFLFARMAPLLQQLQSAMQEYHSIGPSLDAASRLNADLSCLAEPAEQDGDAAPPVLARDLEFKDVWFGHGGAGCPPVLRGVSFHVPAGTINALIGPSGSGKSTVADLVLGFLKPDRGEIAVDGAALAGGSARAWRSQVAYVPQDGCLLDGTIRDNLQMGRPYCDADLWQALESAQAADFVHRLPDQLATHVGERGLFLSGGERQRLALARALVRRPRLLVLDEATSALDGETQAAVAATVAGLRGDMTVLTIAHRLSMIAFADNVIMLECGSIVESGRFADLAHRPDSRLNTVIRHERRMEWANGAC